MAKTEVYSWRVSPQIKQELEMEARRLGVSLAALLDRMALHWLNERRPAAGAIAAEQVRLHANAARTLGSIRGGDPNRTERRRDLIRKRLARRHGR